MEEVFEIRRSFVWRGLGEVPQSALAIRPEYKEFDGEVIWKERKLEDFSKRCICGKILQGRAKPYNCELFSKACTPLTPIGPCMVSSEGACLAYFKYRSPLSVSLS